MKKLFSSGFFSLTLLCFCLPWISVSCQQQKIMTVTGMQMVSGMEMKDLGGGFLGQAEKKKRLEPNVLAIVALVAAATALLISLSGGRGAVLPSLIGIATAIALKVNIDQDILKQSQGLLHVNYELGFIGYIFLMAGGTISSLSPNKPLSAIQSAVSVADDTKQCPMCSDVSVDNLDMPTTTVAKRTAANFCSQCGTSVVDGSVFCFECGQRVCCEV